MNYHKLLLLDEPSTEIVLENRKNNVEKYKWIIIKWKLI